MKFTVALLVLTLAVLLQPDCSAAGTYLNQSNITVAVGPGTSPGSFNNTFANGQTIEKVIDAPTATAEETHNQATHIWFTADNVGGGLELVFDFGIAYDVGTLHFWNYTDDFYDVDNIDFTFFGLLGQQVGTLSVQPDLGSPGGIAAQDIALAAPLNIKSVTAFLTGDNRQVDFQNIGFTAEVSQIPEPTVLAMVLIAAAVGVFRPRRRFFLG
ncbi:hypothetical protein [Adhaeretor mobilis]|uniref:PEP-CTERM protein-sorting domain-containing protein n=1 Tax=Adhaeretor mobilis TaxID=1930276 RepID=A0A517N1F1_9BACT|nr:hypothetical protein [Adhaeretor mobilis]QDT00838.1 hypothetical protein HG15A2_41800 [Adhaeretor mobilis]